HLKAPSSALGERRLCALDNRTELADVERSSSYEKSAHVRGGEKLGGVARLHAAAVEDARAAPGLAELLEQEGPERGVRLGRRPRRRGAARADRPDRLVRDVDRRELAGRHVRERRGELAREHGVRRAGLALEQRLADADERTQLRAQHGADATADGV